MTPRNQQADIPREGWRLLEVIDLHLEQGRSRKDYEDCEYCGNERIRYVHILNHPRHAGTMRVGCICSEHLTGDKEGPRKQENDLRNRAARRINWLKREWKPSAKGNRYLTTSDDHHVVVYPVRGGYKLVIDGKQGQKIYVTQDKAKLTAFDYLYIKRNAPGEGSGNRQ